MASGGAAAFIAANILFIWLCAFHPLIALVWFCLASFTLTAFFAAVHIIEEGEG
jgi:hypothetical protein